MSRKLCKFIFVAILGTISGRTFAFTKAAIAVGGPGEQQISGVWDTGNITISFKDELDTVYHETVAYGQFSTFASIASAFGAKFSNDYYCSGLWAYASGTTITIVAKNHSSLSAFSISGPTTSFVAKAIPIITWPTPVPVPIGTALSSLQLNAVANIPGTFTYTPAAVRADGRNPGIVCELCARRHGRLRDHDGREFSHRAFGYETGQRNHHALGKHRLRLYSGGHHNL